MKPTDLPGVGPRLGQAIRSHFASDEAFGEALTSCDVAAISAVDGVSEQRAVDWILHATGRGDALSFLATPEDRRIHEQIVTKVQGYAATRQGRDRLRLLAPLPDRASCESHCTQALQASAQAASLDQTQIRKALRRLNPLTEPAPRRDDTLVIAPDPETMDDLTRAGVDRWCEVAGPEALRNARDHGLVLVVGGGLDTSGVPNAVDLPASTSPEAVCPRLHLTWANANRQTLEAMAALESLAGTPGPATSIIDALDAQATAAPPIADIRRRAAAADVAIRKSVDAGLKDLALSGSDLMAAMEGRLPAAVREVIREAIREASKEIPGGERLWDVTLPPCLDEDELDLVVQSSEAAGLVANHECQARAAVTIAACRDDVAGALQHWIDFDARNALGAFVHDPDLRRPRWGQALDVREGIHLDLARDPSAQRITYCLGDPKAAVLTGANSGGKSTLLEHLAQTCLMARMGLPVVGEATVPWLDAIHLVTPRKGLDAGAFETFLTGFLPLCDAPGRNLVLADELEATTEIDAAGRILAFWLDRVATTQSLVVLVTHVAHHIVGHVSSPVRVDGIEAKGLDEEGALIVDRRPIMGRQARSTPELIVERLARRTGREVYRDLAHSLRGGAEATTSNAPVATR